MIAPRTLAPVLLLTLALLGVGLGFAPPLHALTEQQKEDLILRITDDLRCPTCQGLSVRDSEASLSVQIKEKVRRMVEEGQSEAAIKAFFVSRYGEWILRSPQTKGLGLVLWILPGLGMVLVAGWIGLRFYRRNKGGDDAESGGRSAPASLTPEQLERIARDRRRFEDQD